MLSTNVIRAEIIGMPLDWSSDWSTDAYLQAIFNMVGPSLTNIDPNDTPDRRTQEIFDKMDENHDGVLTKEEFVKGCMADEFLYQMLTADTSGSAPWPIIF